MRINIKLPIALDDDDGDGDGDIAIIVIMYVQLSCALITQKNYNILYSTQQKFRNRI